MKTPEQKAKDKYKKAKNSIRVIGKLPEKKKRGATWEFELFKKIARERILTDIEIQWVWEWVMAKHMFPNWEIWQKPIHIDQLTVTNFSHIVSKGMDKTKRLDPDNIEIVSRAYHEWQHTKQIPQTNYIN